MPSCLQNEMLEIVSPGVDGIQQNRHLSAEQIWCAVWRVDTIKLYFTWRLTASLIRQRLKWHISFLRSQLHSEHMDTSGAYRDLIIILGSKVYVVKTCFSQVLLWMCVCCCFTLVHFIYCKMPSNWKSSSLPSPVKAYRSLYWWHSVCSSFAWQATLKHMDPTGGWSQFTSVAKTTEYCSS